MTDQQESLVIWWLDPLEVSIVSDFELEQSLPDYIRAELRSLTGRAGRGRLWVPSGISLSEIDWPENKPLAQKADRCGGIVIHERDKSSLPKGLGFTTDLELNGV